jgi:hypothetical protein
LAAEIVDGEGRVGQLVLDLLAPRAMPPLDRPLGLGVAGAGVDEVDAEVGADVAERLRDVCGASIYVVGARQAVLEDGLLEAVLLRRCALAWDHGEVAVKDEARRVVDLREEDDLVELAVGTKDGCARVHRIADPEISGMLGDEASSLGGRSAHGAGRDALGGEESMDGGARELALAHDAGALEHANDAAHGASRLLTLGAHDEVGDLGANGARGASVRARVGHERVETTLFVEVEPALDGARRETHDASVGRHHVVARGGVREVRGAVAVLEARADERAEHAEAKEADGSPLVVVHDRILMDRSGHKRWDRIRAPRCPTSTRCLPRHMRRSPRSSRCTSSARAARRAAGATRAALASSPTLDASASSATPPLAASSTTSTRADAAKRARQRCSVRAGIGGAAADRGTPAGITTRSTVFHARQRCRARNIGRMRQVAPHSAAAQTYWMIRTTAGRPSSPRGRRSG